jgi:cytochrome c biogenesis protein
VEYRQDLKRIESLVAVVEGGREVKESLLSPNTWLAHRGTSVYQTAWGTDRYGFDYIGVQVSRDPGSKIFWAVSLLFSVSLPLFLFSRRKGRGSGSVSH